MIRRVVLRVFCEYQFEAEEMAKKVIPVVTREGFDVLRGCFTEAKILVRSYHIILHSKASELRGMYYYTTDPVQH